VLCLRLANISLSYGDTYVYKLSLCCLFTGKKIDVTLCGYVLVKGIYRSWGLFSIALLCTILSVGFGQILWNVADYQRVGGVLYVFAVCLTPLTVYAFETATGLWVDTKNISDPTAFRHHQYRAKLCRIAMEISTLVVVVVQIFFLSLPFLAVPIAITLWLLTMDGVSLFYDEFHITPKQRANVSATFGFFLLIAARYLELTTTSDWSSWSYLLGALALTYGLAWYLNDEEPILQLLLVTSHVALIYFSYSLDRIVLLIFGTLGLIFYYVSSNVQFLKRVVNSRSVVYSHALIAVTLLALSYCSHLEDDSDGHVEFILAVIVIVSFNLMWFKLALSSTEFSFLLHFVTNTGYLAIAKFFDYDISLYFFRLNGSIVLITVATICILGNNFGAKLLEVEAGVDRALYHLYRFLFECVQVVLSLYFQTHALVICGCAGMLFHVWIAAFYKHPDWRKKYRQAIVDILLLWFVMLIATLFASKILFLAACVLLCWILAVLQGKSHVLTSAAVSGTILLGILLDSTVLMAVGGFYLFFWLFRAFGTAFKDSLLFPFVLIFLGLVTLFLGVEYQWHQDWLRTQLVIALTLVFPHRLEAQNGNLSLPLDLTFFVESPTPLTAPLSIIFNLLFWPRCVFSILVASTFTLPLEKYFMIPSLTLHQPIRLLPFLLFGILTVQIAKKMILCFGFKGEDERECTTAPAVRVKECNIYYPSDTDNHGIVLEVTGVKDPEFTIDSAKLYIEGNEFWRAVDTLIGAGFVAGFKRAFYPVELHSKRMNLNIFQRGVTEMKIIIQLATGLNGEKRLSQETIRTNLRRLSRQSIQFIFIGRLKSDSGHVFCFQ
jgi:hypothetical protein